MQKLLLTTAVLLASISLTSAHPDKESVGVVQPPKVADDVVAPMKGKYHKRHKEMSKEDAIKLVEKHKEEASKLAGSFTEGNSKNMFDYYMNAMNATLEALKKIENNPHDVNSLVKSDDYCFKQILKMHRHVTKKIEKKKEEPKKEEVKKPEPKKEEVKKEEPKKEEVKKEEPKKEEIKK